MHIEKLTGNPNNNFITKDVLNEFLSGKTVLLVNSFLRLIMQDTFTDFKLQTAREKYILTFIAYKMSKNFEYSNIITRTLVHN